MAPRCRCPACRSASISMLHQVQAGGAGSTHMQQVAVMESIPRLPQGMPTPPAPTAHAAAVTHSMLSGARSTGYYRATLADRPTPDIGTRNLDPAVASEQQYYVPLDISVSVEGPVEQYGVGYAANESLPTSRFAGPTMQSPELDLSQLHLYYDNARRRPRGADALGNVYYGFYCKSLVTVRYVRLPMQPKDGDVEDHERHCHILRDFAAQARRVDMITHPAIAQLIGVVAPGESEKASTDQRLNGPYPCAFVVMQYYDSCLRSFLDDLRKLRLTVESRDQAGHGMSGSLDSQNNPDSFDADQYEARLRIATQIASGLKVLHNHRIPHRDFSASKVMLTDAIDVSTRLLPATCSARIIDVGIVLPRSVAEDDPLLSSSSFGVMSSSAFQYMSPEAGEVDPENVDAAMAADIYAFGIVLYEILTLQQPWYRQSLMDVRRAVCERGERPKWPDSGIAIDEDLRMFVERMWHQNPCLRPSASAVHEKLERAHDFSKARVGDASRQGALPGKSSDLFLQTSEDPDAKPLTFGEDSPVIDDDFTGQQSFEQECSPSMSSSADHLYASRDAFSDSQHSVVGTATNGAISSPSVLPDSSSRETGSVGYSNNALDESDLSSDNMSSLNGTSRGKKATTNSTTHPIATGASNRAVGTDEVSGNSVLTLVEESEVSEAEFYPVSGAPGQNVHSTGKLVRTKALSPSVAESLRNSVLDESSPCGTQSIPPVGQTSVNRDAQHDSGDGRLQDKAAVEGTSASAQLLPPSTNKQDSQELGKMNLSHNACSPDYMTRDHDPRTEAVSANKVSGTGYEEQPPSSVIRGHKPSAIRNNARDVEPAWNQAHLKLAFSCPGYFDDTSQAPLRRRPSRKSEEIAELLQRHRNDTERLKRAKRGRARPDSNERGTSDNDDNHDGDDETEDTESSILQELAQAERELDCDRILQLMRDHGTILSVACRAMRALCAVARDDFKVHEAFDTGALDELMKYGCMHESDGVVCAYFCRAITAFAERYDSEIGHSMRALGVPLRIVEVMDRHRQNSTVQIEGCCALRAVCGAAELARIACVEGGAPIAVFRALSRNIAEWKDAQLAKVSLQAFAHIARGYWKGTEAFLRNSSLESVCRTCDEFPNDGIENDVLQVLQAVAEFDEGRDLLIRTHGMHTLSSIMLRESSDEFDRECCCVVTQTCCLRDAPCEKEMIASNITERIVRVLRRTSMPESANRGKAVESVAIDSARALASLATFGEEVQTHCRLIGAIEILKEAWEAHFDKPDCTSAFAICMHKLLLNNAESILSADRFGLQSLLSRAREEFKTNTETLGEIQALQLLLQTRFPNGHDRQPEGRWKVMGLFRRHDRTACADQGVYARQAEMNPSFFRQRFRGSDAP